MLLDSFRTTFVPISELELNTIEKLRQYQFLKHIQIIK